LAVISAPVPETEAGVRVPSALWETSRKVLRISPQVSSSPPGMGKRAIRATSPMTKKMLFEFDYEYHSTSRKADPTYAVSIYKQEK
jgi:hypothetical protein